MALHEMRSFNRRQTGNGPRWRVAILAIPERSSAALKTAVIHAGGRVVVEAPPCVQSVPLVARSAPDVPVVQPVAAADVHPEVAPFASSDYPVVLFTSDTRRPLVERAVRAGVAAWLVLPLRPSQLRPTLDLAIAGSKRSNGCDAGSLTGP
jgi:AmiR/NasT family two-component response regulator